MIAWTRDELSTIGTADEREITTLRGDGTARKPVMIWVVRHGEGLYISSYKGRDAAWFRSVKARHEGHIQSGGVTKDVAFVEERDPHINDALDAVYHTKYRRYASHVTPMISPRRATTLKLVPHSISA